jgi:hypothetical protein
MQSDISFRARVISMKEKGVPFCIWSEGSLGSTVVFHAKHTPLPVEEEACARETAGVA